MTSNYNTANPCATMGGLSGGNAFQKQAAFNLMKGIESGDPRALSIINPTQPNWLYIQHSLVAADGLAGVQQILALLNGTARVNPVRVFQDGDHVFIHTDFLNFFGPNIGFDIFRYENGFIVEHWDQLQTTPSTFNPSGRSMIDGPTQALQLPLEQSKANKDLARHFVNDILVNRQLDKVGLYFEGDVLIQHNPTIADGVSNWLSAIAARNGTAQAVVYTRTRITLGDGDFALVASDGTVGGNLAAFYDLFRLENGKIIEHWDCVQAIPPRASWRNNNGKF
ncbi:hypothetical protein BV898_04604 [Hypsibius exemplaris]|uniref:SnoaL-like domain-containing protein n=1 Tax=Hypsibius exemplaris TaxID=2072580 RepID=A0A1W0X1N9_HYPEX|nr:hypothetical protein BV898_04604 [Hypsibius exemplaris]